MPYADGYCADSRTFEHGFHLTVRSVFPRVAFDPAAACNLGERRGHLMGFRFARGSVRQPDSRAHRLENSWKVTLWPVRLREVLLLLIAVGAHAQLAVQGPQPVYEGQTVSAIDLIGNPHRDVEPLRPLIEQKAGEPYSQSK